MARMFTPTRLFYIVGAVLCGSGAGGYVAWAIYARFARIAELNDRALVEPHVLVVLCVAGGLLAFPLGAAGGMVMVALGSRAFEYARRSGSDGDGREGESWVTRRGSINDGPGD